MPPSSTTRTPTDSSASISAGARPQAPVRDTRVPPALLLAVIAVCTAVTVANIYLAAPLLGLIAEGFGVRASALGWVAALGQLGYAAGLLLFAPLGDTADRRRLVAALALAAGVAMTCAGLAPGLPVLGLTVFVASAVTVVPQLLVPLVAERAPAERRGRHLGAIVAGLFTGIVAARVLGAMAGDVFGWRAVFIGSAVLTVLVSLGTAALLPADVRPRRADGNPGRGGAANPLRGMARTARTFAGSAELRRACARQSGLFGAWSALWTSLALLLTGAPYHLSTGSAGLFGLFGLSATAIAPLSGGLVDRFGARRVVNTAYVLAAVALPLFWLGGQRMWALCAAALLVHAGLVAGQVANQMRALSSTDSPSAANTGYIVVAFISAAAASALAGPAFTHFGWTGVCAVALCWLVLGYVGGAGRDGGRGRRGAVAASGGVTR
ncbi:MFS transporter [Streptomyces daliensis]|uniref:MFS transporter n=1 Tax=Streptomyces daliensis TaxID=299421 RepID=A0A8T4J0W9_9ACTN|nr:MFS transporter [Streptomyces daliensis]